MSKRHSLEECNLGRSVTSIIRDSQLNFEELPVLYMTIASPPSRAVMMVAAALDIPLNLQEINVVQGDQMDPDYIKKNPQHTVPMLQENNFCIWDSHAIAGYLVSAYGKSDDLYPKDPRARAIVDQRLHFDSSVLFANLRAAISPLLSKGETSIPQSKYDEMHEAYGFLEKFLEGREWLAGDGATIADICCVATLSSCNELLPVSVDDYPNVLNWFEKCKELPYYAENNEEGNKLFGEVIRSFITS